MWRNRPGPGPAAVVLAVCVVLAGAVAAAQLSRSLGGEAGNGATAQATGATVAGASPGAATGSPPPTHRAVPSITMPTAEPFNPTSEPVRLTGFDGNLRLAAPRGTQISSTDAFVRVDAAGFGVVVERWPVGVNHDLSASPGGRIGGASLGAISDAIDAILTARLPAVRYFRIPRTLDYREATEWVVRDRPIPGDGTPMMLDLVVAGDSAFLFTSSANPGQGSSLTLVAWSSILGTADFLQYEDITAFGGRLAVRLDPSEHVEITSDSELLIEPDGRDLFGTGGARGLHVWRFELGGPVVVHAPGGPVVTVRGASLDALVRSLGKADPRYRARGLSVAVDGHPARRWSFLVADLGWLGRAYAQILIAVDGRDVYVMTGDERLIGKVRFPG